MASQFSAIRGRNPLAPTNFGNAILANSGNAYQAALQRDQNTLNQQQLGLQTQALGLQRQQADQSAKDSKNAILVSALGLAPKIYGMFSDSATSDAINAGGEGVGGAASAVSAKRNCILSAEASYESLKMLFVMLYTDPALVLLVIICFAAAVVVLMNAQFCIVNVMGVAVCSAFHVPLGES